MSEMKVVDFDIKQGIFHFEIDKLETSFHSHPVVEIIMSHSGTFKLETESLKHQDLTLAVIESNTPHRIISEDGKLELLMLESNNPLLESFLSQNQISFSAGVFIKPEHQCHAELIHSVKLFSQKNDLKKTPDERVNRCLETIEEENPDYSELIDRLVSKAFLSESRLSHLFRKHVGISLKKYLVWNRLKNAFHFLLNENANLTEASHQSGFYDQAHLSNAFKRFLGINPASTYNSRTVQV